MPFPTVRHATGADGGLHAYSMRGTFALCIVFLISFGVLFLLDWAWLAAMWQFGT